MGFFSSLWSDVKSVAKSPVAEIAASYFLGPEAGALLGGSSALGGAAIGAGMSALGGGNILQGAALGGLGGYGAGAPSSLPSWLSGADPSTIAQFGYSPTNATALMSQLGFGGSSGVGLGGLGGGAGGGINPFQIGAGLYGMELSNQTRQQADPMAQYRAQYAQQLNALMQNPSSVTSLPGYQAGLDAVQRSMAAQGYTGSGNMMAALQNYGGQFYQQQLSNLSSLAAPSAAGTQGNIAGNLGMFSSLGMLGKGLGLV